MSLGSIDRSSFSMLFPCFSWLSRNSIIVPTSRFVPEGSVKNTIQFRFRPWNHIGLIIMSGQIYCLFPISLCHMLSLVLPWWLSRSSIIIVLTNRKLLYPKLFYAEKYLPIEHCFGNFAGKSHYYFYSLAYKNETQFKPTHF